MTTESFNYKSLTSLQKLCLCRKIPFVSYRLPLEKEIITFIQYLSSPEKLQSLDDLDEREGFVVAPFTASEHAGGFVLKPDVVFTSDDIDDAFLADLKTNNRFMSTGFVRPSTHSTSADEFITSVNNAITTIESNALQKVVLSKVRLEQIPENFDPEIFFLKLCDKYPHAFVYILQLPEVGCWIGATPEPLLTIEENIFKTVSLAGTQVAGEFSLEAYKWSSKEFAEQEIVTNFVEQTLRALNIDNYKKTGPSNYQAANLIHLMTTFEFSHPDSKNRLSELLKMLHPTPSVGGLPKTEALNFILGNEKHNRRYYSGFLGPVNFRKKSAIFVNLRCLEILEHKLRLYSGAGITASSVAEKEWEETDNKMLTLLNVLKN